VGHFLLLVKIRGGVGEIPIPIVKALPAIKHLTIVLCVAAEHGGLINKERKRLGRTNE